MRQTVMTDCNESRGLLSIIIIFNIIPKLRTLELQRKLVTTSFPVPWFVMGVAMCVIVVS